MRAPVGEGRERLLQALFGAFGESGPDANLSMRQVAERIGVHHTLLTYHFGSRPLLLRAILSEARRRDNVVIAADGGDLGFEALCRNVWSFYSDPAHVDRVRAFFHLVGLGVYEPDALPVALDDVHDLTRILESAALRDGSTPHQAERQALLASSVLRGLLLQRLLAPTADVDAAAELFLSSLDPAVPAGG